MAQSPGNNHHDATQYRIDITNELIKATEDENERLKETIQSRDEAIQQLQGRISSQREEMEAIPITRVTERNKILERQISEKEAEVNRLNERLQIVLSKDGSSSGKIAVLTEANTMLEKRRIINVQTIQKCKDDIGYRDKTISELKAKLAKTEDAFKRERATLEKLSANYKIMEEEKRKMVQETSLLKAELTTAKHDRMLCESRINELQQYEEQCGQKEQYLHSLIANILPDKERTISALTVKVTELEDYLETKVRDTIPRSDHLEILHVEVERTRNTLRETYREEYQTRVESLEAANAELERKLEHVECDLRGMEDKRDELLTATEAYKRLVKENVVMSDTIKQQKEQFESLSQDLVSSKERMVRMDKQRMNNINDSGVWFS